jgi:multiple sugar transport system permease protein
MTDVIAPRTPNKGSPGEPLLARRPAARRRAKLVREVRRNLTAYGFLLGGILCFALFTWYPMVREVIWSFQRDHLGVTQWVGFSNYTRILHDPTFWQAWRNTLQFTGFALVLGFVVPFFTAIMLNEMRHALSYLRILVYLPVMLTPVSGLLLFQYFYDPSHGLFDYLLREVHLPASQFLQNPHIAMLCVVIASTWLNMGSATLIYLAALQNIPGDLYEAAELDGAGVLKRIWHVTVPQTRPILMMLLMLQIVATMQVFVEPFILTNGGAGPQDSTLSIVTLLYNYAFIYNTSNSYSAASALGVIILLVLGAFSIVFTLINRDRD